MNMTINNKCYTCEEIARAHFGMSEPASKTAHCLDGVRSDGKTLEVKTLFSSRPSLGGAYVLKATKVIREAIESYCTADFYAFFLTEDNPLYMERQEAVEWLLERVVLDRMASARGGHYKLKIGRNPRTEKQNIRFAEAGFIL